MLTIYQSEKLAIAQKLLQEVKTSVNDKDFSKEILLGDAIAALDEIIQQDLPERYTLPVEEAWYTPRAIQEMLPEATIGDRILEALSRVAGTTIICVGLSAALSLGCWGVSEFKASSNDYHQPDFAAQSRGYFGLTMIFASITGANLVLIGVADREVK